jgi:hypothetical protein
MEPTKTGPTSPKVKTSNFPFVLVLCASALCWGILIAVFPPEAQNFPLNDDWSFSRSAFEFARTGRIDYLHWASMPQLGQWLWAYPFLQVLGESFFALRISTIVLSWLGLWAFYDLLRQEDWAPSRAAFAAGCLASNPLFFLLQGTFMTDVPALSMALVALALYARAIAGGQLRWLLAAAVVATLAAVTRQNTVGVAIAAGVLLWRYPGRQRNLIWWGAVAMPLAAGVAVHFWFRQRTDTLPYPLGVLPPENLLMLPFASIHLLGLEVLPLLGLVQAPPRKKRFMVALILLAAGAGYWYYYGSLLLYGSLFPYLVNMLSPWGAFGGSAFGPVIPGNQPVLLGDGWRWILSAAGCLAGAGLVHRFRLPSPLLRGAGPLLLFSGTQLAFILMLRSLGDRYLLFLFPAALAAATFMVGDVRPRWRVGLPLLLMFAFVSVGLMHDWLAWNGARWSLGRRALAQGIPASAIEGGFEWDGWFATDPDFASLPVAQRQYPVLPLTARMFPHITGQYALSFSELPGSRRLDSETYSLWLLSGPKRSFYLIQPSTLPKQTSK